ELDRARRPRAAAAAFPMRGGGAAGRVVVMGGRPSVPSGGSVVVGRWGTWDVRVRLRGAVGGAWSGGCGLARPGPDRARTRPGEHEVRLRPAPQHPAAAQHEQPRGPT